MWRFSDNGAGLAPGKAIDMTTITELETFAKLIAEHIPLNVALRDAAKAPALAEARQEKRVA